MFRKRFCFIIFACFSINMLTISAQEKVQEADKTDLQSTQINLSAAVLILPPIMSGPEIKASEMLLDEVKKTKLGALAYCRSIARKR